MHVRVKLTSVNEESCPSHEGQNGFHASPFRPSIVLQLQHHATTCWRGGAERCDRDTPLIAVITSLEPLPAPQQARQKSSTKFINTRSNAAKKILQKTILHSWALSFVRPPLRLHTCTATPAFVSAEKSEDLFRAGHFRGPLGNSTCRSMKHMKTDKAEHLEGKKMWDPGSTPGCPGSSSTASMAYLS